MQRRQSKTTDKLLSDQDLKKKLGVKFHIPKSFNPALDFNVDDIIFVFEHSTNKPSQQLSPQFFMSSLQIKLSSPELRQIEERLVACHHSEKVAAIPC